MALAMKHAQAAAQPRRAAGRPVVGRNPVPRVAAAKPFSRAVVRAVAEGKAAAAEARWASQIKEGRVVNVSSADVKGMMQDGWVLLDVRSPAEVQKAPITGAVTVPLFQEDTGMGLMTLLAKWAHFGTGGWWVGGTHMIPNPNFIQEVQTKVPKDSRVVVACQKGLRSLAACEQLSRAGYSGGLAWINGGLDTTRKGELETANGVDVRYAGIGGMSEVLGWTAVQQEESKELLGGSSGVIKVFVAILVADLLLFAYEAADAYFKTGSIAGIAPH